MKKKLIIFLLIIMLLSGCNKETNKEDKKEEIQVTDDVSGSKYTIKLVKKEVKDEIKFNKYLERDEKTIYFANNINELYLTDTDNEIMLKDYIANTFQTLDNALKNITKSLKEKTTVKNAEIYKELNTDITIIKCNTKNYYIGDYNLEYNEKTMCK